MARLASPTSTEGFGFTYADKVGAIALLDLLSRSPFADQELGVVVKVQFGQRPSGWHFDDLLLTLDHLESERRIALSIKSSSQVSNRGISEEIVDLVWQQATDGGPLVEANDRLALVQPSTTQAINDELTELYRWASRQADGQLEAWLQPGVANSLKRIIADCVRRGGDKDDAQRFFRLFRMLPLDLDPPQDQTTQTSIAKCLTVLQRPTEKLATSLWTHLCQLAAEARGSAGGYTLSELVSKLTPHFVFREHPRVEQDLARIRQFSTDRHISSVRDVIGDDLRLPTTEATTLLEGSVTKAPVVLFLGASGTGKSVALRHFVESPSAGELRLYFRADLNSPSPSFLEQHLSLQHSFADCLSEGMFGTITLVVDQVDRLLTEEQIADVVQLLASTKVLRPRLRVIFGCQTAEAERILSRLSQALERNEIHRMIYAPDEEVMFQRVIERFPPLRNIAFRQELRPIFLRAKNLDLLVGRLDQLGQLSGHQLTSQKQFIDWFWDKYVADGAEGISRATAMREIADLQADLLSPYVNPQGLQDKHALDSLRGASLVSGDDQGITFQHDLYGDWARLRSIDSNRDTLVHFFQDRGKNPLWLRAMRLWSAILLETEGANAWKAVFDQFAGDGPVLWLMRDALFDGLGLAAGSYQYLIDLSPILFSDGGALLRRFFVRFLFSTSSPNDALAHAFAGEDVSSLTTYRSEFRVPHWYLWGPVVRFVADNADECRSLTPNLTIQIIEPWLESIPLGSANTPTIARLGVAIAFDHFASDRYWARENQEHDFKIFRCLFLALRHLPEEAEPLILRAIGRLGDDPYPEAELRDGKRYVKTNSMLSPGSSRVIGPWPDGPVATPNNRFREFILMGGGIREMYAHSPEFAREVILASVIRDPYLEDPNHGYLQPDRELSIVDEKLFYPPLYRNGLFSVIFNLDAEWARGIILTIVGFTVDRLEDLYGEAGLDEGIDVFIDGGKKRVVGGSNSFGWHRDDGQCPDLVVCALMALENHLYDLFERDEGKDVLQSIVECLRYMPVLGLLVTLGKRFTGLLQNQLRFLHFSEFVQWSDIRQVIGNENHQMISWTGKGEEETQTALGWHNLPHRKQILKAYAFLALNLPEGREEAREARIRWKALIEEASPDDRGALENLIAIYTIENYTFEEQEDGVLIQCNLPDDVQRAAEAHQARTERSIAPLFLAMRCRSVLDGREGISDDDAMAMYDQCRNMELDGQVSDSIVTERDAFSGVAAVLLLRFPHVLEQSDEVKVWCVKTLIDVCHNPPRRTEFDSDQSVSNNQWCHFAAQALPGLWVSDPTNQSLREAMANLIEEGHYKTTAYLATALFPTRYTQSRPYQQSVSLLRSWAVEAMRRRELEHQRRYSGYNSIASEWPNYQAIREAFIDDSLSTDIGALPNPVVIHHESPEGRDFGRDRERARPLVDTNRLYFFMAHLPWYNLPDDSDGREEVVARWKELFSELISELKNGDSDNLDSSTVIAYQFERQLFGYFGQFAAGYPDSSLMSEWVSEIVAITPYAENHAEQFIHGVFSRLLASDVPDTIAVENWLVLMEQYLGTRKPDRESWRKSFGAHGWQNWLVGNDHLLRRFNWKDSHSEFITAHALIFESWCRAMCGSERDFISALAFLRLPPCRDIYARACLWIHEELNGQLPVGRGSEVSDALASFLAVARPQVSKARRANTAAFDAFLSLTAMLNVKNNRLAMQLFEDSATLF